MASRPQDLIYAVDERPPGPQLALLGLQHAVMISVYLVLIVIIMRAARVTDAVALSAVGMGLVAIALASALQALRLGPVGSGYLAPPVYSAIYLGPSVLAAETGGLPAVLAMTVFAGLVEILLSAFLGRLRRIFTHTVSGFVVSIVGFDLGLVGLKHALAVEYYGTPGYAGRLAAAGLTLAVCIGLSVWARGMLKMMCSLAGILVGSLAALAFGLVPAGALALVEAAPLLRLPDPSYVGFRFDPALLPSFLTAGIAATLRTIGVITSCQKINDADWKRPEMGSIRGGVLADGIGCALGGLLGATGMNTAPSLVGLSSATGATSRYIAFACAAILLAMAFIPKFAALFLALPLEVAGAALVFTGSFMISGGIQIMVSRNIDIRTTYVIGIAFLVGLAHQVFVGYFTHLPPVLRSFTGSTLSVSVLAAVALTLIFRLGIARRQVLPLSGTADPVAAFSDFLRRQGKSWNVGPDVIERCIGSLDEALGHMRAADLIRRPLKIEARFDQVDLVVQLDYEGTPLSLPNVALGRRNMVEEESFAYGLAYYLTGVFADRVECFSRGSEATLRLTYAA
jgi:xanthine permease XanP